MDNGNKIIGAILSFSLEITTVQLAEIMGKTPQRVNQLVKNDGLPKKGDNCFYLPDVWQWFEIYSQSQFSDAELDLEEQKARLTKAQADLKELELAKAQGVAISSDDIKKMTERVVVSIRSHLMPFPKKVAPLISIMSDEIEIEQTLNGYLYQALNELSEFRLKIHDAHKEVQEPSDSDTES